MDALEAIRTRRSIRQFESRPVPGELVEELLRAASSAPSANNQQPWCFVVVDDRGLLDQVPPINPYAAMCRQAPLAILVCGDPRLEEFPGYWVQDCAAAVQNMLLAAHARGLGAVWTGVYPREDRIRGLRKLLGVPEPVVPMALVVLGYPAEHVPPEDRYREDRVHRNGW
jgi:nitroreductase